MARDVKPGSVGKPEAERRKPQQASPAPPRNVQSLPWEHPRSSSHPPSHTSASRLRELRVVHAGWKSRCAVPQLPPPSREAKQLPTSPRRTIVTGMKSEDAFFQQQTTNDERSTTNLTANLQTLVAQH